MYSSGVGERKNDPATARGAALASELRGVLGQLRRRLHEQAHDADLTWSQKCVILHLEREGSATVTTLAKVEGVRPQSMGATVAALETAGLLRRKADPTDGRRTLLSLTTACRQWIKASRTARGDWLCQTLCRKLDAQEQTALAKSVKLLQRLVTP